MSLAGVAAAREAADLHCMADGELMYFGTLLISGRDWLWPALLLLTLAVGALFWAYSRAPVNRPVQATCLLLKLIGLAALFACLLEPLWSGQRARPGANFVAILADNSQGMRIKDAGESRSRGEAMREVLTSEKTVWQGKLEETFQVRRYSFDSRLHFTKHFGDLTFDGRASSIGGALHSLAERYRGQPVAGVMLFTDGNATDLGEGLSHLPELPPIYPVLVGNDTPVKDISIQKVTVTQTAFEDAPVSLQADVTTAGFSGREVVVRLTELMEYPSGGSSAERTRSSAASNSPPEASIIANSVGPAAHLPAHQPPVLQEKNVAEQTLKSPGDGRTMAFRFQVRPEKSGIRFYRVRVAARDEVEAVAHPESSSEATLANNSQVVAVDRGRGPYRVLYVAGRPNWEYKFLHRALEADDQVQLAALIRIAKREPKMEFRGRAGESSNPLFRGFGNQSKEETERYDQPVIRPIAPNEDEFIRLRGGFPQTAEELFRYHAIILDDLESEFFTRDQMVLVQKFVSERGGGFLMLGGQESFTEGNFQRTPIGDMLPVYLGKPTEHRSSSGFQFNLNREGWLQPWARLRNNEADERKRLASMPPFQVLNEVRETKPGASTIATVSDAAGKIYPALVVQRYGHGRTAALAIGDLWLWGLRDKELRRDMDKSWRQMVRWLVADVPLAIEMLVEPKRSDPDQAVLLRVRVRDDRFQPLENASVSLIVRPIAHAEGGSAGSDSDPLNAASFVRLNAEAVPSEPGLYEATYIPRATGGYLAEALVTNPVGAEVGRAEAGWTSDPAAEEFRSLQPNRALLQEIAKKTGGEVIAAERLEAFAAALPQKKAPIAEEWTLPLWHQPVVFLFALACFAGEWGLRRWKGLA